MHVCVCVCVCHALGLMMLAYLFKATYKHDNRGCRKHVRIAMLFIGRGEEKSSTTHDVFQ